MSLSITEMRDDLRDHLGVDEDDLPTLKADLLLNRAWWEVMDKFEFREKEAETVVQTSAGLNFYVMPMGYESLRILSIGGSSAPNLLNGQFALNGSVLLNPGTSTLTQHKQLDRISEKTYEGEFNEDTDDYGVPTGYFRFSNGIKLWPTPDNTYSLNIRYLLTLGDLSTLNPTPPIPQVWHEIILYGAIWRGFQKMGDYNRAEKAKQTQFTLINTTKPVESKEEFDSSTAGLNVLRRTY